MRRIETCVLPVWILGCYSLSALPTFFRKDFPIGDRPNEIVVGDFDGDGRPDLAIASFGGLYVLMNAGGGNFGPLVRTQFDVPVLGLVVADFNRDGKLDLAAGSRLLLGQGDGTFLVQDIGIGDQGFMTTADINGDGTPDLVITDALNSAITVLLGNGDGTFRARVTTSVTRPARPVIADFNRDGKADIAVPSGNTIPADTISLLLGNGDGTVGDPIPTPSVDAYTLLAADFDRDGLPDLATPFEILLGKGDGHFQTPLRYMPELALRRGDPVPVVAADFDGDGRLDLTVMFILNSASGGPDNTVSIFFGKGDGSMMMTSTEFTVGFQPQDGPAVDLDGDGKADLAIPNFRSNTISLLLSRAPGGARSPRAISVASTTAIVAPQSLATLFASIPITGAENASSMPWPTRLGGITLEVQDSTGRTRIAPLLYVSPTQINFQVPKGTALGEAALVITTDGSRLNAGGMQVEAVAPGIFMASYGPTPAALCNSY
jgi:hypothetical protein